MNKQLSEMSLEELWELFPIILKEHNPKYVEWYNVEKQRLLNSIDTENIIRVNHIGSSAVAGLISKPTIDILLEIDGCCSISQLVDNLNSIEWVLMSQENDPMKLVFNKGYTPDGFLEKTYHLHVRYAGDWSELYFRDFLKAHPDVAAKYGQLKLSLWKKYEHDRDGYTEAKSEFIHMYTNAAKQEFRDRHKLNGVTGWISAESILSVNITEQPIIRTESSVQLRQWELSDTQALVAVINNINVLDNLRDGIPYPYTEKDAEEFINSTLTAGKDTQYAFAIVHDGKVVGSVGAFRKDNVHRLTAEMGYYIAEPYWGKGIATDAIRQACDYIFENTDIIRVFAEPYANNCASCRVLEKAGFQYEGLLRRNALKNGTPVDMKMYAILKVL